MFCQVTTRDVTLTSVVIYSPSGHQAPRYLENVNDALLKFVNQKSNIIIMEDFNTPRIQWDKLATGTVKVICCNIFLNVAVIVDLTQIVKECT